VIQKAFRSKSEERLANMLDAMEIPYEYEPIGKKVFYRIERNAKYLPDFIVGDGIILEVKGYLTSADRSKYLRIAKWNPFLDLRFVFDRPSNLLNKKSRTTYAEWAEQHGFLWYDKHTIGKLLEELQPNGRTERKPPSAEGFKASRTARKHQQHGSPDRLLDPKACRVRLRTPKARVHRSDGCAERCSRA
jgi:hypothetical protein